jgi:hypothetical protein
VISHKRGKDVLRQVEQNKKQRKKKEKLERKKKHKKRRENLSIVMLLRQTEHGHL